jgi:hypothetical protein
MTKKEFLDSLIWIDGTPPSDYENGSYISDGFSDNKGPIICERKSDGEIFVVGDSNFLGGVCDCCVQYSGIDVKRYAYLWSEK